MVLHEWLAGRVDPVRSARRGWAADETSRELFAVVGVVVFGAVPAALALTADPFGAPRSPIRRGIRRRSSPTRAVRRAPTARGTCCSATISRDAQLGRSVRGPRALRRWPGDVAADRAVQRRRRRRCRARLVVARDGTAMATWRVARRRDARHYSSVRPPGGAWGAPQLIVADLDVNFVQFAMSDTGDAIAAWADRSPAGTWAGPAGGWGVGRAGADHRDARNYIDVAMSATGDAVVAYRGPTPGAACRSLPARRRRLGRRAEVMLNNYPDTLKALMVEFDGPGARSRWRASASSTTRSASTSAHGRGLGTDATRSSTTTGSTRRTRRSTSRSLQALVRHPQGAVAVWSRRSTSSNFNDDIVVSRLSGAGWETPQKVFDLADGASRGQRRRPTTRARSCWPPRSSTGRRRRTSPTSGCRSRRRSPRRGPT